jgi:CrcB protein
MSERLRGQPVASGPGRPVDPDVDLHVPEHRGELHHRPWVVLSAIAAGGALGGLGRHGLEQAFPTAGGFPWTTFGVNVSGCLLIGVLMVLVGEVGHDRPLARPFLGVGLLGGFTTFSLHVLEVYQLAEGGAAGTAIGYLAATAATTVLAGYGGMAATRARTRRRGIRGTREAAGRMR